MNRDLPKIKNILLRLINIYQRVIELINKERECLIKIDSNGLIEIVQQKQIFAEEIEKTENELKDVLSKNGVDTINEFLFFASKNNYVDDVRVLNGKLKETLEEFRLKSEVNRMIAQEHAEFFTGLLNLYASFFSNSNYDKNAKTNIGTQIMSVRV